MNINSIDKEIHRINDSICRHIKNLDRDGRGYVAQDVVADLRHLVDHVSLNNTQGVLNNKNNDIDGKTLNLSGKDKRVETSMDFPEAI